MQVKGTLKFELWTEYFWNAQQYLLSIGQLQFIWSDKLDDPAWLPRVDIIRAGRRCSELEFLLATGHDLKSTIEELLGSKIVKVVV